MIDYWIRLDEATWEFLAKLPPLDRRNASILIEDTARAIHGGAASSLAQAARSTLQSLYGLETNWSESERALFVAPAKPDAQPLLRATLELHAAVLREWNVLDEASRGAIAEHIASLARTLKPADGELAVGFNACPSTNGRWSIGYRAGFVPNLVSIVALERAA